MYNCMSGNVCVHVLKSAEMCECGYDNVSAVPHEDQHSRVNILQMSTNRGYRHLPVSALRAPVDLSNPLAGEHIPHEIVLTLQAQLHLLNGLA